MKAFKKSKSVRVLVHCPTTAWCSQDGHYYECLGPSLAVMNVGGHPVQYLIW